ncbi:MAG: topoisomerase DNA-binding C4 zinc finger domain-containing protein, partial [Anaerolineae bacterium]|nr:topoisomerase DNA-binding C4 zinc finger domain-containing protein [Anaerolineae bacterium]
PEKPVYKSKPGAHAQAAHEAMRPTDMTLTPDKIKEEVGEGAALYGLIWRRFIASQMAAAIDRVQTVTILTGKEQGQPYPLKLEARATTSQFDGFRRVYQVESDVEEAIPEEAEHTLPSLEHGQRLELQQVLPEQKQTQPPSRFTEAQLVRELEKRGIGRPSTYAAILSNIKSREYVKVEKKRLVPTESGRKLLDYLLGNFAPIFTYDYTAKMENLLDAIATGETQELDVLNAFWQELQPLLRDAAAEVTQPERQKTGEKCPQCGSDLVLREGKHGQFIGCSGYPTCRYAAGFAVAHQPLIIQPIKG